MTATLDNKEMTVCGRVLIKLYLQKQVVGRVWPKGQSLLIPGWWFQMSSEPSPDRLNQANGHSYTGQWQMGLEIPGHTLGPHWPWELLGASMKWINETPSAATETQVRARGSVTSPRKLCSSGQKQRTWCRRHDTDRTNWSSLFTTVPNLPL